MNNDTIKKKNNPVVSAANAWIICDSKSRPNHKYYYNQALGVPVWNLTDAEIAAAVAAKNAGTECLEPPGPPPVTPLRYSPNPTPLPDTTVYNKQVINNQLSSLLINQRGCNPYNVWDNPPIQSQQFQAALSASASIHQAIQQLLPATKLQNTDFTISVNVHQRPQNPFTLNENKMSLNKPNKWSTRQQTKPTRRNSQHKFDDTDDIDLRQKLVRRKRSFSESKSDANDQENCSKEVSVMSGNNGTPRLGLLPLKNFTSCSDSDQLYIVVETDVILNNYTYLDSIISEDPDCHLVVPHHVSLELEALACDNVPARRILRFLTHQIESGLVILGDKVTGSNSRLEILETCVRESMENNHVVVLISNNEQMMNYRNNKHGIHVFTMRDIKDILDNRTLKPKRVPQRSAISPTRAIKIIVPNTNITDTENNLIKTENTQIDSERDSDSTQPALHEPDSEIIETPDVAQNHRAESAPKSTCGVPEPVTTAQTETKKEIRLNRSISANTTNTQTERKFKWRMKRDSRNPSLAVSNNELETEIDKLKLLDKQTSTTGSPSLNIQRSLSSVSRSGSERSSRTSSVIKDKAVFIPETSSSVISNSVSLKSDSPKNIVDKKVTIREAHMFHVACQGMSEILATRCDEWVSRFVQIMEEVLREKLQEDPPFENKEYPPPWHLHEAAKCIIKKYSDHFNIVNAANKLSYMLYKISDAKGKIHIKIEPTEYMELYSYGVYLVETLKDVSGNCEDLLTASESLKRILFDVQNANSDMNPHDGDADADATHETLDDDNLDPNQHEFESDFEASNYYPEAAESLFPEVTEINFSDNAEGFPEATDRHFCYDEQTENPFPVPLECQYREPQKQSDKNAMNNTYNLRSQKKISHEDHSLQNHPMIGKDKSSFFKILNLTKTFNTNSIETKKNNLNGSPKSTCVENSTSPIQIHLNNQEPDQSSHDDNKVEIKRIFIKCPQFENKLKMKAIEEDYLYEDEEVDYYEDHGIQTLEESEATENAEIETTSDDSGKMNQFLGELGLTLKSTLARIHLMCKSFDEEMNIVKKSLKRETLKEACSLVQKIHSSLYSIINQEQSAQDTSHRKHLKLGNEDLVLHTTKYAEFRYVIAKTMKETEIHLNTLRLCISYPVKHLAQV